MGMFQLIGVGAIANHSDTVGYEGVVPVCLILDITQHYGAICPEDRLGIVQYL